MLPKHVRIAQTEGVEAGFDAYCASVISGQGMALAPVRAKAESILGKRLNVNRKGALDAYCKAFKLKPGAIQAQVATDETPLDITQIIAEAIAAALGNTPAKAEPEAADERRTPPKDAARNAVLWRLNVEGLLSEALDASEGDYITQAAGTSTLTAKFGAPTK